MSVPYMNMVTLVGTLTKNPKVIKTRNKKLGLNISLVTQEMAFGKAYSTYHNITVFGKAAQEGASLYKTPVGSTLYVAGKIHKYPSTKYKGVMIQTVMTNFVNVLRVPQGRLLEAREIDLREKQEDIEPAIPESLEAFLERDSLEFDSYVDRLNEATLEIRGAKDKKEQMVREAEYRSHPLGGQYKEDGQES